MPLSVFTVSVFVSGYILLLFLAVCFAAGIYYLTEVAEEYLTTTKRLLLWGTRVLLLLQALLWVWDRLPALPLGVNALAHLTYYQLVRSRHFPYVHLGSTRMLTSVGLFLLSNVLWLRQFWSTYDPWAYGSSFAERHRYSWRDNLYTHSGLSVASFMFLYVWLVPFGLFLTLGDAASASRTSLPGGATPHLPAAGARAGADKVPGAEALLPGAVTSSDAASSRRLRRHSTNLAISTLARTASAVRSWF
ncbi:hypothetical protein CDCA_CDCA08G2440 [Cyanidium caldarium]|uniref:Protein SVP26 n=1 Tax=Cyanidium caldarium TaxID=2771 RepID=A0AAV9IWE1_CYACA|nr:hypothetical protein CDCA_CDCA08G2440 [Cyanidium caldarium]